MRFDPDCTDFEGACRYFHRRALQGLADGFTWTGRVDALTDPDGLAWGAHTTCHGPDGTAYASVYVYAQARGRGHLSRHLAAHPGPYVTAPDCDLERLFLAKGVAHVVAGRFATTREYHAIERHYDDRCARRSGVPLMNHIDEGVAVLRAIGASERAARAFAIHPLVQLEETLPDALANPAALTDDPAVLLLAMEYRNVANACLSHRALASADEITLGPLPEVHAMLVADQVQNRKDFDLHHRGTHPRSDALERYFALWLQRLGVDEAQYRALVARITVAPSPVGGW